MAVSYPSLARRVAAGVILAAVAGSVAAVKLTRADGLLLPPWLAGVLPNLACAAVIPLAPLMSSRRLLGRDLLAMTLFTALGLGLYEVAQLWMPRRTFDWADLAATAVGSVLALAFGGALFLLPGGRSAGSGRTPGGPSD